MKALVTYDLPADDKAVLQIIEEARTIGFPMLTISVHVDPGDYYPPVDGMSAEAVEGYAIAERVAELDGLFASLAYPPKKISARLAIEEVV